MIENSFQIELHHVQYTLNFTTDEEALDLRTFILSGLYGIVFFLYPTLEIGSILEILVFRIGLHQHHVPDQRLHLKDLSIIENQNALKIMTTIVKTFQSRKT